MQLLKHITLLAIFLNISIESFSQQIFFAKPSISDSDNIRNAMSELAFKVAERYKKHPEEDKISYFSNLFRYEMIAELYESSLHSLETLRSLYKDTIDKITVAFPFWTFAAAQIEIKKQHSSFESVFDELFSTEYNKMPFKAATAAENYFNADLKSRQSRFLDMIKKLQNSKEDSISFNDAQSLCFSYLNYLVYTAELPRVKKILEKIINETFIINDSVLIPMRDGAKVSATIVRPRHNLTPQPVVFKFGIYASESKVAEARFIAGHGYAAIIADTRGKRLSNQALEPFEHDADDAYDIIDWVSKQEWCNGKIGMYGGSYLGFTQWAAVKKIHPALKTIVPQVAVGIGVDFPGLYGVYWTDMLNWIHLVSNNKLTDWSGEGNKMSWDSVRQTWYTSGKAFNSLDSIEGRHNNIFQRFLKHPLNDEYWRNMIPYKEEFGKIKIPVLSITGYYDDDQRGAMYYFGQHHKYNPNPEHYLVIGPYDHYGAQGYPLEPPAVLNGYSIDSVANIKIMDLIFQWFDYTLKGGTKPELLKDKINFEVMGANKWRHTSSLSKMNNDSLVFYISKQKSGDHYKLSGKNSIENKSIKQTIHLADRSDSKDNEIVINSDGAIIDTSLRIKGHLTFVSDPLTQPYELNGSFVANLNATINKKDMDLVIRLYEQLPDGRYFQLSNNIARCSYIKDFSKRQLLVPGKLENIFFANTFFTSKYLQKGSRIILVIGINKNPHWQINYGTGKDVSKETIKDATVPFQIQWMTNNSYIKLPVWK